MKWKEIDPSEDASAVDTAKRVLKETLQGSPVSLDEIGRRMGHTRGYMSRALRGINPLTIDTIVEALELAQLRPADYFAAVAKALAPESATDTGTSQARIEEVVLRTLRRLGWVGQLADEEPASGSPAR